MPAGAARRSRGAEASTCRLLTAGRGGPDEEALWPVRRGSRQAGRGRASSRLRRRSDRRARRGARDRHGPRVPAGQLPRLPLTNDEADRLRFPRQRARGGACGVDGPLAVRLRSPTGTRAGTPSTTGSRSPAQLAEHGCDLIHVEAGQTIHDDRPQYRRGFLTALSDRVRNGARVPTLVGGYLTTLDEANTIVGAGRADLVLLDLPDTRIERTCSRPTPCGLGRFGRELRLPGLPGHPGGRGARASAGCRRAARAARAARHGHADLDRRVPPSGEATRRGDPGPRPAARALRRHALRGRLSGHGLDQRGHASLARERDLRVGRDARPREQPLRARAGARRCARRACRSSI